MATYNDDTISLDDSGITIKHYHRPGHTRNIPYNDIVRAEPIALRFGTGRYRLVGFSPGRPRHFFHWDNKRSAKTRGVSLDVGQWQRLALTPDDPDTVLNHIRSKIGQI